MTDLITGISGVRGIAGTGLTPGVALRFARAFAGYCRGGKILVGRDPRMSGNFLFPAVTGGLMACGCEVVDLGICASPTILLAVRKLGANGGIMITASHNPVQWNGLKFICSGGFYLSEEQNREFMKHYTDQKIGKVDYKGLGEPVTYSLASEDHIEKVLRIPFLDVQGLKRRKFKVVLDCVCGSGGVISPALLKNLGCDIIPLYCDTSGMFPHDPEPRPENLAELCRQVREHGADLGFANDPDVDRLLVVSEKGEALSEEYTLAMAADLVLSKTPGNVFINHVTSRMVEDVAERYGCRVTRTSVGEINVTRMMLEGKGVVGGEGNGGVMLASVHPARDAVTGMALVLAYMLEQDCTVSECVRKLPSYFMRKDKFDIKGHDIDKIINALESRFASFKVTRADGVRIELEGAWVHVRKSNTEPVIRVCAESRSPEETERLVEEVKSLCLSV
jgi:phosphomannomutase